MKHIHKNQEPEDFARWRDERPGRNPRWKKVAPVKNSLHTALMVEQGFICAYCGMRISHDTSHIDHIKPKSIYKRDMYYYENMLALCIRQIKRLEPRHCGYAKDNWFEEQLFISPLNPDCEQQFSFTAGGDILPNRENNIAARTTIEKLALNIDNLRAHRKSAIEAYIDIDDADDVREIIESLEEQNRGKFEPFCFAITHVLKTFVTE